MLCLAQLISHQLDRLTNSDIKNDSFVEFEISGNKAKWVHNRFGRWTNKGSYLKFNGLYEITNITSCKLLNSGVDLSKYVIDVSIPFDSNELIYQGKIVSGFLKYVSTSNKNMLFKTDNETSVLMYTDYKWSTFNSLNLETEKYYYVNGLVSNYNGIQLLPYSSDNAVLSIQSIEVSNLKDKYILGDFSYNDLILKIILSDNSYQYVNVSLDMIEKSDLELLKHAGNHEISISYLGFLVSVNINLVEKNIKSINLSENNIKSFIGEELDLSGIKLNIIYEDNTINTIDVTKEMISGYDSSSVGEKVLSLNYQNYNLSVNYSILKPIVIYDIYAAGGNSGATYNRDFVVLYNNTNKDLELSEYKLAYATKSGTSFSSNVSLSGKIYANGYYVVAMTTGANGVDLPFVSLSGSINAAATSARFALIKGEVPSSVTDNTILDNVFYEGLSATKSYRRSSLVFDTFSVITVDLSYLLEVDELVEVEVSGIKTKYKLGDSLDLTNAVFKAIYQNGTSKILNVTENDIEGFNTTNVGSYKMTYIYEDFVLNIHYTVTSIEGVVDVEIFFIDLGDNLSDCGESTFIKVGNDIDILIDAGEHSTVSANAVMNVIDTYCNDNTLDYVIATHAHSDHIGGMRYVLPNYNIKNVIEFHHKYGATESTKNIIGYYLDARLKAENIYTSYNLINNEGNGSRYVMNIADGVSFTFYDSGYLNSTNSSDKNEQSVICVFEAYGIRVLFNGDAEKQCEEIYAPLVGDVDIFKMPHHGTAAATSEILLQNITPEVAIVCNGNYLGNEYGHPTYDALSRIYNYNPNTLVYAITGATIDSFEAKSSSGAGSVNKVLYGYKSSKKYTFYFACDDIADTLGQRNGNINISISSETYHISSEFYNNNPIEIKQTDYFKMMYQYVNS